MADNDFPSLDIEKVNRAMATRRVSVEYSLRSVPQEGLEGERTKLDLTGSANFVLLSKHHVDKGFMHICTILAGKSNR